MILCFSELVDMSWLSSYAMLCSFDQSVKIQLGTGYYPVQSLKQVLFGYSNTEHVETGLEKGESNTCFSVKPILNEDLNRTVNYGDNSIRCH